MNIGDDYNGKSLHCDYHIFCLLVIAVKKSVITSETRKGKASLTNLQTFDRSRIIFVYNSFAQNDCPPNKYVQFQGYRYYCDVHGHTTFSICNQLIKFGFLCPAALG